LIHPAAIVDPGARVAQGVEIGPYTIIGPDVEVGDGTWIGPHVVINGPTRIGCENRIYQFCSLGEMPQDKKYAGEATRLEIGDRNVIREYCTFNRGTVQDAGVTRVGDDNWIMAYVHLAHDCQVGNHTIFANAASLAGHVKVADYAILGGFTLVHQFCRIGTHGFCAFASHVAKDVLPFVMVQGQPARPYGLNSEGLRRHGFGKERTALLRHAYKIIYRQQLTLEQAKGKLRALADESDDVRLMVEFLEGSQRGILR
jgi:UDP-N-acetylglucosamine acyltransferase